jgi:hypothetical protein
MSSSQPTDDIVPDSSRTAINDIEQRLAAADSFDFTGRIEADGCSRMNFTENAFLAAEALTHRRYCGLAIFSVEQIGAIERRTSY